MTIASGCFIQCVLRRVCRLSARGCQSRGSTGGRVIGERAEGLTWRCVHACSASVRQRFEIMRDALNATGKPFIYAIDDWGVTNTWNYGAEVCRA